MIVAERAQDWLTALLPTGDVGGDRHLSVRAGSMPTPLADAAGQAQPAPAPSATTASEAPAGRPWSALAVRLAGWAVALAIITFVDPDPSVSLMLLALVGVVTIVTESRFPLERRLEDRGLPSREAWVPLLMLAVMASYGLIDGDNIGHVVREDGPVIAFILSFALVSEGLRRSGFIHFLAYRLSERGGGNTTRLILYLFLLSSLLTYFTSNDIVVLTMTPIVVSVAYQARIGNAKLLLLSQFVAANTVSMGILIGSPTNLILGRALDMGFVEYLFLMLVPSALALMATFVFVTAVNGYVERRARGGGRLSRSLVGTWAFSPVYTPPRFSDYRVFTPRMRHWVIVFTVSVVLLAMSTATSAGLFAVAVVIAAIGLASLRREEREPGRSVPPGFAGRAAKVLPVGIVFFGLTYFVIADAVGDAPFVRDEVDTFVTDHGSSHTPVASWGSILSSGALVNTMNDLPAAALTGKILPRVEFATPFDEAVVVQGALVGLNIATYVTPVGALAGIIWFDILQRERARRRNGDVGGVAVAGPGRASGAAGPAAAVPFDVEMPTRRDLVAYGATTFLAMTAVLGATNFGFVALADVLLGPTSGGTEFGGGRGHLAWMVACLAVAGGVVLAFWRVLATGGVALAHLGDLLAFLTRARLWAARHRRAFAVLVMAATVVAAGTALYWAEGFHGREYDVAVAFDGPSEFATWLFVFVTSGLNRGEFPHSVVGNLLAGALVLGAIASVVLLVRLRGRSDDSALRLRVARGEVPTDRLVVVNAGPDNGRLLRTLGAVPGRFLTVAAREPGRPAAWGPGRSLDLGTRGDRTAAVPYAGGASALVRELRLVDARELVLLSRSVTDDFDNLALLGALDAALDRQGPGDRAAEGELPAVVVQAHGYELATLLDQRLGERLRAALAVPPFEPIVRRLLVAKVSGSDGLARSPFRDRDTGDVRVRQPFPLPGVHADVVPRTAGRDYVPGPVAIVETADGPARRLVAAEADGPSRPATGTVVVEPAAGPADAVVTDALVTNAVATDTVDVAGGGSADVGEDRVPGPGGGGDADRGPRPPGTDGRDAGGGAGVTWPTVWVLGGGRLAQACARDLLDLGVGEVTLVAAGDDALLPGVEGDDHLTVVRCGGEAQVAAVLAHDRLAAAALLVIDEPGDSVLVAERLLERLSVTRFAAGEAGRAVPPLFVCCRGRERAERLRSFVVDDVVDATWVESSYAAAFTTVYFDVVGNDEELAGWPTARRLAAAHDVASRLCHLDVWPAGASTRDDGGRRRGAAAFAADLAPAGGGPGGLGHGPLVGVARVGVDRTTPNAAVVTVDVVAPTPGEPLGDHDLLVGLPYP
jgi:arsenical pump membrane protein